MFWNQVKKKLKSERAGEKKMRAVGMFLNEGEKEHKRRGGGGGIEIVDTCVEEKKQEKKKLNVWMKVK